MTHRGGRPLRVTLRTTAKRGNKPDENEDSAASSVGAGRFAVSDGASAAAQPKVWSRLLAEAFVNGGDPLADDTLRRSWQELVREFVRDPTLAWHVKEKLACGSAATFLGVRVEADGYHLTAVGDSCLFHLAGRDIVLVAPLTDWTEFSRFPELVHTTANVLADQVWSGGGSLDDGDVLLLATDAVAKYLLQQHSETGELPPILDHLADDEQFSQFIEQARERGLDNDDSTVCVVWT